jgi:hypothetical protein
MAYSEPPLNKHINDALEKLSTSENLLDSFEELFTAFNQNHGPAAQQIFSHHAVVFFKDERAVSIYNFIVQSKDFANWGLDKKDFFNTHALSHLPRQVRENFQEYGI